MNKLTLYENTEMPVTTAMKYGVVKDYFKKFLLSNNIKEREDRARLLAAFDLLAPVDMMDAIYCANIVHCQFLMGELNEYREKYKMGDGVDARASYNYRWSLNQPAQLMRSLAELMKTRNSYVRNYKKDE